MESNKNQMSIDEIIQKQMMLLLDLSKDIQETMPLERTRVSMICEISNAMAQLRSVLRVELQQRGL